MALRVRWFGFSLVVALAVFVATAVVSCGSSGRGSGAASDGSAASSGDSSPQSGPSSGGGPSSGTTTGGTTTGGTTTGGTTTGGTPSAGAADAGAAGAADACQGLVGIPDAGRAIQFGTGTHRICARATSDPSGQLALGIAGGSSPTDMVFRLYGADGVERGEISVYQTTSADIDPWFHSTGTGYAGLVHEPPPALTLRSFDHTGGVLATTSEYVASSAPDGHGGTVTLAQSYDPSISPPFGPTRLTWRGPSGEMLRTAVLDQDPFMLIVNWGTDHVLTLLPSLMGLRARWYDAAGVPLTAWFDTGALPANGQASLHLLVDGTVALSDGQKWLGTFADGAERMDSPPAWLAARPGTRLATIRQGRAYAVLPFPTSSTNRPDQATIEIMMPSGQSCGRVTLPPHATEPGVTPTPTALDVGEDGTVIQTETLTGSVGFGIQCGFRWWAQLLK